MVTPTIVRFEHIWVTLEDGCEYHMNPTDGNPEGWAIELPGGFTLTCPHGFQAGCGPATIPGPDTGET